MLKERKIDGYVCKSDLRRLALTYGITFDDLMTNKKMIEILGEFMNDPNYEVHYFKSLKAFSINDLKVINSIDDYR